VRRAFDASEIAARKADEHLKRLSWLAHFLRVSHEAQVRGERVTVSIPLDRYEPWERSQVSAAFRKEAAKAQHDVRLGLFVVDVDAGHKLWAGAARMPGGEEIYAGHDQGEPYCFVVQVVHPDQPRLNIDGAALGLCGMHARFGEPGAPVAEWLQAGGALYAAPWGLGWSANGRRIRGTFGLRTANFGAGHGRELDVEMCATGTEGTCAVLFLQPLKGNALTQGKPVVTYPGMRTNALALRANLIDQLINEFGEESFSHFWRSDRPVTDAFAGAFGISVDQWMRDVVQTKYGRLARGPRVASADAAGVCLFLLLCGLWAIFGTRRRAGPGRE